MAKRIKRALEIAVISDVHLGTYGCHAMELLQYLKSIRPEILILNGDIIDMWQFKKRYFPKEHMQVLRYLMKMTTSGVEVYYLTGNHDEALRRFTDFDLGNLHLRDQLTLTRDGQKMWFFHGDVFDTSINYAKWLAKIGGWSYDMLIYLNRQMNALLETAGYEKMSFSKKIKNSVKSAIAYINRFEEVAADFAASRNYQIVVCGHIHQPQMREIMTAKGGITYLNSGDWVENLTALEYDQGEWSLYEHFGQHGLRIDPELDDEDDTADSDVESVSLPSFQMLLERVANG